MSDNHWAKKTSNPGPISPEGKAISSKNARKHGCCTVDATLLPTESPEDFKALERTWCQAYNPNSEPERHLIAELVNTDWLLQRARQAYLEVESGLYTSTPNPNDWTEAQERKLGRFLRYKSAHANAVLKARKAIEDHRKSRLNEQILQNRAHKSMHSVRTPAILAVALHFASGRLSGGGFCGVVFEKAQTANVLDGLSMQIHCAEAAIGK